MAYKGDDLEGNELTLKRALRRKQHLLDKADQARSVNFRQYTQPKNVICVEKKFNKTIGITKDPRSNITLFNSALTAKPI